MKNILILLLLSVPFFTYAQSQQYELSVQASRLNWKGYAEVGGFTQVGTLALAAGKITVDTQSITKGSITVNMKSLSSPDKSLTRHLKAKDFFEVKKFPAATLVLKSCIENQVTADLTIKGITQPIQFPIALEQWQDGCKITGQLIIDRTKYGIKYNSSSFFQDLGNYAIRNEFDLEFVLVFQN